MFPWIFLLFHLCKRGDKEGAVVQEAFLFPPSLLRAVYRHSLQFPLGFFPELAFLSGATGGAVQGHPWKLLLAKQCISKCIRQEKDAFAICQFNPTEEYFLPDIQADQTDPLLLREKQVQASTSIPLTKRWTMEGRRGWSLRGLQALPWLCCSADMVEFSAWQGSICYAEPGPRSNSSSRPWCFGSFCSLVPCGNGLWDLLSMLDSQSLQTAFCEN